MPKSGTTWLARCLSEHPQVFVPPIKETMYFAYRYSSNISDYESYFCGAEAFAARGEFCTLYFYDEDAARRIKSHYPDVKLLLVLRNPIEQIYSHYWHLASQNFHSERTEDIDFENALVQFPERLIMPARYGLHLPKWLTQFERGQLLPLLYDDIRNSPLDVLSKVFDFLGVDPGFLPSFASTRSRKVRVGGAPRSALAGKVYRWLYHELKTKVFDPLTWKYGTDRVWRLKDQLRVREILQTVFYSEGYPEISPKTKRLLLAKLESDIAAVEALVEVDLSHWRA